MNQLKADVEGLSGCPWLKHPQTHQVNVDHFFQQLYSHLQDVCHVLLYNRARTRRLFVKRLLPIWDAFQGEVRLH
jgi:hypothetical protein